jgi:hypothetical protein
MQTTPGDRSKRALHLTRLNGYGRLYTDGLYTDGLYTDGLYTDGLYTDGFHVRITITDSTEQGAGKPYNFVTFVVFQ